MTIKDRIEGVDLNAPSYNSDYRAALHQTLRKNTPEISQVRAFIDQDFAKPLDTKTTTTLNAIRSHLFQLDPTRAYLILSPIGPFGIDALLTKTSSLKVAHVSGRPADVVADPTIQLAAEVYRQRASGERENITLGTSHRCVRLQRYKDPSFTTSFEMFATIDSTNGQDKFYEEKKILQLITFYSGFFRSILGKADLRISLGNIKIAEKLVHDNDETNTDQRQAELMAMLPDKFKHELLPGELYSLESDTLAENLGIGNEIRSMKRIFEALPPALQQISSFPVNRILGLGHYNGPVFMVHVNDVTLVDGGSVKWISTLTSNDKERAVVSGFGIELFAKQI